MAVLIVAFFLGRNLKVENAGKRQLVVETVIGGLAQFLHDMLGEERDIEIHSLYDDS